jgi:pimeloyl-ACP methyl ester carboxylesterase
MKLPNGLRYAARLASVLVALQVAACGEATGVPLPDDPGVDPSCNVSPIALQPRAPYLDGVLTPIAAGLGAMSDHLALPYTYLLHIPDGLPQRPVPLLLAIHGLLGTGAQFAAQGEWTRLADEHGFIVAFPTGPRKWDTTPGSFDVRFMRAVIEQVRSEYCIDARRIWAAGHSYGGFMTQRLACEAGDLIAAGAVVSSGNIEMPVIGGPCDAGQADPALNKYEPVPLAFWHGTEDQVIPYQQSRISISNWAQRYGCALLEEVPDAAYGAVENYGDCTRTDVADRESRNIDSPFLRFHTYNEHKHGYPDGCGGLGELGRGRCDPDPGLWPTLDFHQAEVLGFLLAHPRIEVAAD